MMDQLEQNLRDVVLAEPPLGIDPDRVADVAARKRKTRRGTLATGVGVVAVAALAAGALAFTGAGGGAPPAPPAAQLTPKQKFDKEVQRNVDHIRDVLQKMLPGKQLDFSVQSDRNLEVPMSTVEVAVKVDGAADSLSVSVSSTTNYGTTDEHWNELQSIPMMEENCKTNRKQVSTTGKHLRCTTTKQPDGSVLTMAEGGEPIGPNQTVAVGGLTFANFRPGRGVIQVSDYAQPSATGPAIQLLLTEQQLVQLVTDPELMLDMPRP